MTRTNFRELREKLTPSWLSSGEGGLVGYALDLIKDAFAHRAYLGVLAGIPEVAPPDANEATGRDRRVVPAISETNERYTERLVSWLDDRATQGSPYALLSRLREYLGDDVLMRIVDNRGNWYSIQNDGSYFNLRDQGNWDWDGNEDAWSRFWVIIYPPLRLWRTVFLPGWNEGGEWGDDSYATWGSTAPADQVNTVRAIIADWKPAHARCVNIIVAFDPASFDPFNPEPDGLWHRWSKNVGGVQVPARLATARYWDGV